MPIDPEYVRQHYASLSDDALLLIERDELTPAAQAILDSEIRRRNLDRTEPLERDAEATGRSSFFGSDDEEEAADADWLENAFPVTTFSAKPAGLADAADARDALTAAGIPCDVTEHEIDPDEQEVSESYRQYRVIVPATFGLQAVAVLDTAIFNPRYEADLQVQFESLSDDELRALNVDSLCAGLLDRATRLRKAYEREIGRRSLTKTKGLP